MADTPTKIIDYISASATAIEKAGSEMARQQAMTKEANALIPKVVDALVEHKRILPHEKEAATKLLQSPTKALELLAKVAAHRTDEENMRIGKPDGRTKKASNGLSPHMGRVRGEGEQSEAWDLFASKLGVG